MQLDGEVCLCTDNLLYVAMLVNIDNIWIKFEGGHRSKFTFTGGNKYSASAGLPIRGVVRGPKI